MAKQKSSKKDKGEIKPRKPAEVIDQETQVTKVQELTDAQQQHTPIEPNTVIVDPKVESEPVKEEPVLNEDREPVLDREYNPSSEESDPHNAYVLNKPNPDEDVPAFDKKKEKKLAGSEDAKEPTRYGAGKEKLADEIEDTSISRHYPPPPHGNPTGGKNEYPR